MVRIWITSSCCLGLLFILLGSLATPQMPSPPKGSRQLRSSTEGGNASWLPTLPNLLKQPTCPSRRHWKTILPAKILCKAVISVVASGLAILLALIVANIISFIAALAHMSLLPSRTPWCRICLVCSLLFATVLAAMLVPSSNMPQLAIRIPARWSQVADCSYVHFVTPPLQLFPVHAGHELTTDEKIQRRDYFCSAILCLLMTAFAVLKLLTWFAKACRYQLANSANDQSGRYQGVCRHDDDPDVQNLLHSQQHRSTLCVPWYQHLALHLSGAIPAVVFALAGRLDARAGACWEVYLLWLFVVLGSSLLHAICLTARLPMNCEVTVPDFAAITVESVLPVVGERLDTLKDWLFIGLALTKRTLTSFLLAFVGVTILVISNTYMRVYHAAALTRFVMPEQAACCDQKRYGFLTTQTSPAKLAIAITEDLPQACLQSLFVALYGGSSAQSLFIAISCAKIVLCFGLRSLALAQEGRYGDSYEAAAEFYRTLLYVAEKVGLRSTLGLWAETNLAKSLGDLGKHEDALAVHRKVLRTSQELLDAGHPDIVTAQANVAWSLGAVGEHEEALDLLNQVVDARNERFGSRDPDTIDAEAARAWNLTRLKRYDSAINSQTKILNIRKDTLGQQHEDTLNAQANLAWSLGKLARHDEALDLREEVFTERSKLLGERHPDTLRAQSCVAATLQELGRHSEALKHRRQVLEGRREALTPKHPDTVRAEESLKTLLESEDATPKRRSPAKE
ncbi:klc-2 [Symbiodinium sp. CCMP2592]|nr:klc-2 [Symbiodinium sp. CCMP2592]